VLIDGCELEESTIEDVRLVNVDVGATLVEIDEDELQEVEIEVDKALLVG